MSIKSGEQVGELSAVVDTRSICLTVGVSLQTSESICDVCLNTRNAAMNFLCNVRFVSVSVEGSECEAWEHFEVQMADMATKLQELFQHDINGSCLCSLCLAERFAIAS